MKMLMSLSALVFLTSMFVAGQRPSFAGTRPIGFPSTPNRTTTTQDPLGNRFGDGTTERLPIEANGDRDLIDRLSKLPIDKQPFWFINWQALEAHRQNPQTYPQRPNVFVDPIPQNSNTGTANRFSTSNSAQFELSTNSALVNRLSPTANSNQVSSDPNSELQNKNGVAPNTSSTSSQNVESAKINSNSKQTGHEYF